MFRVATMLSSTREQRMTQINRKVQPITLSGDALNPASGFSTFARRRTEKSGTATEAKAQVYGPVFTEQRRVQMHRA